MLLAHSIVVMAFWHKLIASLWLKTNIFFIAIINWTCLSVIARASFLGIVFGLRILFSRTTSTKKIVLQKWILKMIVALSKLICISLFFSFISCFQKCLFWIIYILTFVNLISLKKVCVLLAFSFFLIRTFCLISKMRVFKLKLTFNLRLPCWLTLYLFNKFMLVTSRSFYDSWQVFLV